MNGTSAGWVFSGALFRRGTSGRATGNSRMVRREALGAPRVRAWTEGMIALHPSSSARRKPLWMRRSPALYLTATVRLDVGRTRYCDPRPSRCNRARNSSAFEGGSSASSSMSWSRSLRRNILRALKAFVRTFHKRALLFRPHVSGHVDRLRTDLDDVD